MLQKKWILENFILDTFHATEVDIRSDNLILCGNM